ncbi:MAG: YdeI/OmpD-associated family protein [Caulobacterales bacterium]|jgi:uncharacterized protein YdeI (YjbR/CyaY-like superfamily)
MITDVEAFFEHGCGRCPRFATPDCSTRQWLVGLLALRDLCQAARLTQTVKWGHPCYMHAGRNIVIMGAFRDDFRLSFMHAALLKDGAGVLQKQGPNTRTPDMIRFTDNAQVAAMSATILAYLKEAMGYAELGLKAPKADDELELPAELIDALDDDQELAEAFLTLTPGRQRSYVIALSSAKTSATRLARIAKFRPKILAGKGALER